MKKIYLIFRKYNLILGLKSNFIYSRIIIHIYNLKKIRYIINFNIWDFRNIKMIEFNLLMILAIIL